MTYFELLTHMTATLKAANVPNYDKDAWRLFEELTGINRGQFLVSKDEEPQASICERLLDAATRRATRVPLQYILGEQEFMDLNIRVSSDTLIPRFDTEILAEMVRNDSAGKSVLDVCTGTGCILLSVIKGGKCSFGVGTDISEGAVSLARENLIRNGLDRGYPRASFFCGDLFEALEGTEFADTKFDIIVSNPPYIKTSDIDTLDTEVRDFEPHLALDGHEDGLYFYRLLAREAGRHLAGNGKVYYEIGCDQGLLVTEILQNEGFKDIEVIKDYSGLDRIVRATYERTD